MAGRALRAIDEAAIEKALRLRKEYEATPDEEKSEAARAWLDAEADLEGSDYAIYIRMWQQGESDV